MGRDRGNHGQGCTGSLEPSNKAGKIRSQPVAIPSTHEVKHPLRLGVGHNEVEWPAAGLMRFKELFVVIARCADAQPANQAYASVIHKLLKAAESGARPSGRAKSRHRAVSLRP